MASRLQQYCQQQLYSVSVIGHLYISCYQRPTDSVTLPADASATLCWAGRFINISVGKTLVLYTKDEHFKTWGKTLDVFEGSYMRPTTSIGLRNLVGKCSRTSARIYKSYEIVLLALIAGCGWFYNMRSPISKYRRSYSSKIRRLGDSTDRALLYKL